MNPVEVNFYLKLLLVLMTSSTAFAFMMILQRHKQKRADDKFDFEMKLIELRNKKHEVEK